MTFGGMKRLTLAFVFLIFMVTFTNARADEDQRRYEKAYLDVDNLILDWKYYQQNKVSVEGAVRCINEDYCEFVPSLGFRQIVQVEIDMLPTADKRHLVQDCREPAPCSLIVTGDVMSDSLMAKEIAWNNTSRPDR